MVLLNEQIKELIKSPAHKSQLEEAVSHEERVKMHTKAVDKASKAKYFKKYLDWVKDGVMLPADKLKAFEGMCLFPLPTTSLCNSVFDSYQKIFETRDSYFDVSMSQDSMKADFMAYIDSQGLKEWFKTKGFEAYKKQFNCLFVVDMPAVQEGPRPQPYFYKVPISAVVDMAVDGDSVQYVIFKAGDKKMIAIDDARYTVWVKDSNGEWMFFSESPHVLGYTPAHIFATSTLYDEEDGNLIARKIPVSDSAGDLDWLLFYSVAQRMYETYGPFPITTVPDEHCSFVDSKGRACSGGVVPVEYDDGTVGSYQCPSCASSAIVGPGTVYFKPKRTSGDQPDPGKAVDITPADVSSLDYITKKIDYLEWEIYANCTGSFEEEVLKEAVNEKQVMSSHEGERVMLLKVKRDFEKAIRFIIDTMGRMMYGDYYQGCTFTFGDQFQLQSKSEIIEEFQTWKKTGLPNYLVASKKAELVQSEYKNNVVEIRRAELLNMLEPWPELSLSECLQLSLHSKFPEKFGLKVDFAKFVSTFERANGDILFWGSALSLDQKVNRLSQILLDYASQEERTARRLEPAGSPAGAS